MKMCQTWEKNSRELTDVFTEGSSKFTQYCSAALKDLNNVRIFYML